MTLRIHNSLSRSLEVFTPIDAGQVRIYVCGITVYDLCHMGHARSAVAFDVIVRWLKSIGYKVTYIKNITDIDDKIIKRALENNQTIKELTDKMIAEMYKDFDSLNILRPDEDPRATDYIPQMLDIIKKLKNNGLAYSTQNGDINYSVRGFNGYGKLSGKSIDELCPGERVNIDENKKDPLDFVLWKSAKENEPDGAKWQSPFGLGRPGWHIECSAMSCALLGETFDIHGGGADLQFPHHENEIAQSEGANDKALANYWIHNGFVNIDGEKMSKSLGNFFTIRDVLKKFDAETIRFFIVRTHYKSPLNYSDVHLNDARNSLKRLYTSLEGFNNLENIEIDWNNEYAAKFKAAMNEDFNTPEAIAVLFDLAKEINQSKDIYNAQLLKSLGNILGILQGGAKEFLQWLPECGAQSDMQSESKCALTPQEIEEKISQRAAAKAARDFASADKIREELLKAGIVLKDSKDGTSWQAA